MAVTLLMCREVARESLQMLVWGEKKKKKTKTEKEKKKLTTWLL